ncbi:MAG: dihydroorotase [Bacteroidales bacterium]|nr:dihydroorotase [Bacteroidales bacterium]
MPRFLLTNASIVTGESSFRGSLGIDGERIAGIWRETSPGFPDAEVIDLGGKVLMAGGIDAHVHFREPGMTAKADIGSESRAALTGGITSFMDMPNTNPPTTSMEAVEDKLSRAASSSWANYGFHFGATNSNQGLINGYLEAGLGTRFAGIKVFMGSSTGNILVDDRTTLEQLFRIKGRPILVHCEDEGIIRDNLRKAGSRFGEDIPFSFHPSIRSREACVESTRKALELAIRYGTRLHLLHISTAEEVGMIREAKAVNPAITAETSANYLWFCDEDYPLMGGRLKCNPSIKTVKDRDALIKAFADGTIDTIGSDHAPHLLSEKERPYLQCPSGIPSVGQSLAALLTIASREGIPMGRIASAFSENPARIFGLEDRGFLKEGYFADLVVIDPSKEYTAGTPAYKCGWSPYEGAVFKGSVDMVWINGTLAVEGGTMRVGRDDCRPQPLRFRYTD